jgi:hypothetical protein
MADLQWPKRGLDYYTSSPVIHNFVIFTLNRYVRYSIELTNKFLAA